jgi:hypothetical protein
MRPLARTGGRWSRRKYHRHSRANLKDTRLNSLIREAPGGNCCVRVLTPGATSGDFARQTWLRLSIEGEAAARYLAVARTGLAKPMAELRFDTFVAVLQAALDGQGVMLAPLETVRPVTSCQGASRSRGSRRRSRNHPCS